MRKDENDKGSRALTEMQAAKQHAIRPAKQIILFLLITTHKLHGFLHPALQRQHH